MQIKAPNAFVLISAILVLVAALTWIIPGGEFQRQLEQIPNYGEKEVVIPGSYHRVESHPQGPVDLLISPMKGFHDNAGTATVLVEGQEVELPRPHRDASEVAGFILLIGGAFGVLQATGALMAGLSWITIRARGAGRDLRIPLLMFLFSLGGALFGMAEETLVFVLITVPLAIALGFDTITGVAIPFVGSQAGFATAFVNPFTLGIAKGIAQQEMGVGFGYRLICWFIATSICTGFVLWHAYRVAQNSQRSLTPKVDETWRRKFEEVAKQTRTVSVSQRLVLAWFALCMVALGVGAVRYGWYINEICAVFLAMALGCGFLGRLPMGSMAEAFMSGAKELCPTAVLVAFSRAIFIIADDARIVDTILYSLAESVAGHGPTASTQYMYFLQTAINFFVPSGSGQAALTMPIMAPLAGLLHINIENAILAFQFGDGFTNMIIPTNPVCLGVVTAVGMSWGTWFRWMFKWQILLFVVGSLLLLASPF